MRFGGTGQSAHARAPLLHPGARVLGTRTARPFSLDAMSAGDPLGDALTRRMEAVVLARSGLPGERPGGPMPAHAGKATKTTPPTAVAPKAEASSATPDARPVVRVSQPTATFMARHPVWVDGAGNEITVPAYAVDGAVAAGAENRPPPATAAERASRRAAAQEARSHELWKKINPGFMRQPAGRSEYDVALAFDEAKLNAAKNCSAANWRHHLRKTDTATYVEAVARERLVAKAAAREAAMPKEEKSSLSAASGKSAKSTDGPAPAPARAEAPEAPPEAPPASDTAAQ